MYVNFVWLLYGILDWGNLPCRQMHDHCVCLYYKGIKYLHEGIYINVWCAI